MAERLKSKVSPLTKTDYAIDRLRAEIRSGAIAPGTLLKQVELAERLGVSPTPVREALRLLEAEGLIIYTANHGATVASLSVNHIEQLYMMRARLEGLAARIAARNMGKDQLAQIEAKHLEIVKSVVDLDHATLATMNRDFHAEIFGTVSPLMAAHINNVWALVPVSSTLWGSAETALAFTRHHAGIVQALSQRDSDSADRLMQEHIMYACDIRMMGAGEPSALEPSAVEPSIGE